LNQSPTDCLLYFLSSALVAPGKIWTIPRGNEPGYTGASSLTLHRTEVVRKDNQGVNWTELETKAIEHALSSITATPGHAFYQTAEPGRLLELITTSLGTLPLF